MLNIHTYKLIIYIISVGNLNYQVMNFTGKFFLGNDKRNLILEKETARLFTYYKSWKFLIEINMIS